MRGWAKLIGDKVKNSGQFPWKDLRGRDQQPSEWEVEELPGMFNWFKNGAKRGRKNLREMHDRTNAIKASLGVGESTSWDRNSDLIETFDRLREIGVVTTQFVGRPQTEDDVRKVCEKVLKGMVGSERWNNLLDSDKELLMREEIKNYFTAERAMLEQILKSYSEMPQHMRTVDAISWRSKLDHNSEAMAGWDLSNGVFGGESSFIDICMPQILANARKMLPPLEEYQKARIDAIGGGSDAENATELNDFLVSALAYSKETAAMIGGLESFARHIMSHEISHTTQFRAIIEMTKKQLNADGSFTLPNGRNVTSWTDITNDEWQQLMSTISKDPKWLVTNLKDMHGVIDRANAAQWLAGKYPAEEYPEGTNPIVRALEITAELAALREQGIIHGEVVDDALAFMDSYVNRRFNEERGISDAEETQRFIQLVNDVEAGRVQLNTSQRLIQDINNRNAKIDRDRQKQEIENEIEYYDSLSSNDLIDEIAQLEFDYEKADSISADNPDDDNAALDAKNIRESLSRAKKVWRDKTGLDNSALNRRTSRRRDEMDLLPQEELDIRNRKRTLQKISDDAENSTPDELITRLAYIKTKLAEDGLSTETRKKLEDAKKIYRDAYRRKASESGDDSSTQKLNREIDKLVDQRINPPKPEENQIQKENPAAPKTKTPKPKPIKTPKNKAATTRHTESERQSLFTESTPEERIAILEMSDPSDKDIAMLLDPELRDEAISRIRNRHDALNEANADVDSASTYDGSLEQQLDNVLLPALDLIERSQLQNTIQIETTIDLTDDQINGIDTNPITIDGLISGKLITGDNPISKSALDGNSRGDKKPNKVVIQVEEGQKGYYPHWSDESSKEPAGYKQKVVLPPGEIEIIGSTKNPDGSTTLIARVKRQKGVEEILDGILSGEGSENIPPGARVDIEKSINRHILSRRSRGLHSEQRTPADIKQQIDDRNEGSLDVVNGDGGSFGTSLDTDYVDSIDDDPDAPGEVESDVFGPVTTAKQRRKLRAEEINEINERLKKIYESGEADEELGISPEDIDPEIIDILNDMTPQQIEEELADEASKVHEEVDKRPRVVVDEEDLEEVIDEAKPENPENQVKPWWEASGLEVDMDKPARPVINPWDYVNDQPQQQQQQRGVRRTKASTAMQRVIQDGTRESASNELSLIQGGLTGSEYGGSSYQNRQNSAGLTIAGIIQQNFGTKDLSKLSDDQIYDIIDILKNPPNTASMSRANWERSASQWRSRLQDYVDIRKMMNNNNYSDPYGNMTSRWDIGQVNPTSRLGRSLSSGSNFGGAEKIGKVSSSPISEIDGKRVTKAGMSLEDRDTSMPVYDIDGEKIAFGNDSVDSNDVKVIPMNPYLITGKSPSSKEGREYSTLWFDATAGQMVEDPSNQGKTSALLYAASRGDEDALRELERLAEVGKQRMAESRRKASERFDSFRDSTKEDRDLSWYKQRAPGAIMRVADPEDKWSKTERLIDLDQDIYMVHQTSYMPEVDPETGDFIIRPSEDHEIIDPETGQRWIDSTTGKPAEVNRGSVHFALNHVVGGHMYRQTPTDKTYLVMIPARSMIDANPGALDNLYAIDTWMTPKPGEGLRFPKGSVMVVELPGTKDFGVERPSGNPITDWTPEQTAAFEEATNRVASESKRIFEETFKELSRSHTGNENYEPREFPAGMHSSDDDIDLRVRDIAETIGATSTKHDGSAAFRIEAASSYDAENSISTYLTPGGWVEPGQLSENAKMRAANNSRFSTSKVKRRVVSDDDFLASGRQSRGGQLGRGFSARAARAVVGRVLENREDIDQETKDKLLMASEVVASFASKGPTGALTQLAIEAARRGGREVAELAIQKMVNNGKITPEQAKIAMMGVDRVAPDGLPDPIKEKLIDGFQIIDEFIDERVLTDENKDRLIKATDDAREKAKEITGRAREEVGEGAKKAKEKTRDIIGKLKSRREGEKNIPSIDDAIYDAYSYDPNDPFSSPPTTLPVDYPTDQPASSSRQPQIIRSVFDDPFEDTYEVQKRLDSQNENTGETGGRFNRRLKRRSEQKQGSNNSELFSTSQPSVDPFL